MGSRIRENPEKLFELFAEIARPTDASQGTEPFVLQKFPDDYDDQEILKSIPKFAFPCDSETSAVDHFTFVQTDIESKFKFGFCRHGMGAQTCLCIISCLPWYEIFYRLLNELAEILNRSEDNHVGQLLSVIYAHEVVPPGQEVDVVTRNLKERFTFVVPDPLHLPRIPDNRNLTEYYNAVDHANMMVLFAAMLFERRILIVSKKLSRLTACIHGAASLIYPMHWQHLYIPVLPPHLLDYCSAPMPFLIGIHSTLLDKVNKKQELGDAVVLDADTNTLTSPYDDLAELPPDIVSSMKKKLKGLQSEKMKGLMGDGVARVFLKTLVSLIGGYRDALKFRSGEQITFDPEAFVQSRPSSMQSFLENMLQLQIFEQFINDRLDLLNAGLGFTDEFEVEANMLADKTGSQSKYKEWLVTAKRQGRKLRREGKDRWVEFTSKVKDKSKKAYKDLKSKMDTKKEDEFSAGISRARPTTLPSPTLRTARVGDQPRRPPPPNIQSPLTTDPNSQLLRRASYEKRSRQYKVLTIDDVNGEDAGGAGSVTRRVSQDDDITYNRVSIDLMNDADIQQVFKKSYSLEDLSRLTSPTIPDIEEAEDALLVDSSLGGYHGLVTVPSHFIMDSSTASSDRSSSSTPTPLPRRNQTSTPTSSQHSSDRDSPSIPRPAPRKRKMDTPQNPLIRLEAPEQARSRSSSPASLDAADGVIGYSKFDQFDPFANQTTEEAVNQNIYTKDITMDGAQLVEDNNNDPMLQPRNRNSIYRANAFYNIQRPPSVKRRTSPTPLATDAQTIKDARIAFMQSEVTKSVPAAVSLTGLDQFDPLLTGQLAVDGPPSQLTGGSSRSSGSSVDTGISAGSRTLSAETVAIPNQEENLLKEWNLDFSKMRVGQNRPVPPPIPPKPTLKAQASLPSYISPVHSAQQKAPMSGFAGQGVGAGTMAFPPSMFYQHQQQQQQQPQQRGANFTAPSSQPTFQQPPRLSVSGVPSPTFRSTSPINNAFTAPLQTSTPATGPPLLRIHKRTPASSDKSPSLDPFSDFDPLLATPGTQARPASYAAPQPRNSWETFD